MQRIFCAETTDKKELSLGKEVPSQTQGQFFYFIVSVFPGTFIVSVFPGTDHSSFLTVTKLSAQADFPEKSVEVLKLSGLAGYDSY